jgi:hypothetical protein
MLAKEDYFFIFICLHDLNLVLLHVSDEGLALEQRVVERHAHLEVRADVHALEVVRPTSRAGAFHSRYYVHS